MPEELNLKENKIFIENTNVFEKWAEEGEHKAQEKTRTLLKSYLELDNVSFLFGTGSTIMLGAKSIQNIPKEIEDGLKTNKEAYQEFIEIIIGLTKVADEKQLPRTEEKDGNEIKYMLEEFLNYLLALEYAQSKFEGIVKYKKIKDIISITKRELFKLCDIDTRVIPTWLSSDVKLKLKNNKYWYHELFTKKILQRPLNLRRVNIFTTNYDLAFDEAFDHLGVHYINGFSGFHRRTFKPENFDYDIYFPGSTTQGKVQRVEKVLKYYKIHGSLTWQQTTPTANNVYGIEEWSIKHIREKIKKDEASKVTTNENDFWNNLMIYPSAAKKSYTLDYPYSELFRQLAATLNQPQSVLITYGYSFCDEHINDIIYQALTIPSFTLIIIDFKGTEGSKEIKRLRELCDPRIIIIQGNQLGDFPYFTEKLLPDFIGSNINEKIAKTLSMLYPDDGQLKADIQEVEEKTIENKEQKVENKAEDDGKESDIVQTSSDQDTEDLPF